MRPYYRLLSDTKQQYRQIFHTRREALEAALRRMRSMFSCADCSGGETDDISTWILPLHQGCGYIEWQKAMLDFIESDVAGGIVRRMEAIEAYKNTFNCHMCGMCCRMASTDAPYTEMQRRAEAGDEFARQFTSIFLPYASREDARQRAPEVVDAVLAEAGEEGPGEERIFFYHCPYIGEDNRCTLYGTEKRPAICGRYPETPLSFMYERCAWKPWKDETHTDMLTAHALLALCSHWSETLRNSIAATASLPENPV